LLINFLYVFFFFSLSLLYVFSWAYLFVPSHRWSNTAMLQIFILNKCINSHSHLFWSIDIESCYMCWRLLLYCQSCHWDVHLPVISLWQIYVVHFIASLTGRGQPNYSCLTCLGPVMKNIYTWLYTRFFTHFGCHNLRKEFADHPGLEWHHVFLTLIFFFFPYLLSPIFI